MPTLSTITTPTPETFGATAAMLDALGNLVRLQILWHLGRGDDLNVTALCGLTGKRQQAVSHHLTILKIRHLVELDRRGKNNFYHLTPAGRKALRQHWA